MTPFFYSDYVYTCNQFASIAVLFPVVQFMASRRKLLFLVFDEKKNEKNLEDADVSQTLFEN